MHVGQCVGNDLLAAAFCHLRLCGDSPKPCVISLIVVEGPEIVQRAAPGLFPPVHSA